MTRIAHMPEQQTSVLIDRLVAGDLDEAARQHLLAWLEADPLRWRQCGLAFLEAQTWSRALREWEPAAHASATPAPRTLSLTSRPSTRRRLVASLVAAFSLILAFALGFAASALRPEPARPAHTSLASSDPTGGGSTPGEQSASHPSLQPVLAAVSVISSGAGPAAVHIPVRPSTADDPSAADGPPDIPEYVRQQWERRGFKIDSERRYVLARLPDGEQVAVPIEQINLTPMETRIY